MARDNWRNRITGSGEEDPTQLVANPKNWRIHPKEQQDALSSVLDSVGWVQQVVVNHTTGNVVDGHLRVELAISREEASVPVVYVELSEEDEAKVLATLDPLSAMAGVDREKLSDLLADIDDGSLEMLLSRVAETNGVKAPSFDPVSFDEQGRLDEKQRVTCPECGHEFAPS